MCCSLGSIYTSPVRSQTSHNPQSSQRPKPVFKRVCVFKIRQQNNTNTELQYRQYLYEVTTRGKREREREEGQRKTTTRSLFKPLVSRNTTTATTTPKQHPLLPPDQRLSTRNEQELLYVGLGEQGVLCASMVFWNASFLPSDAVSSSSSVQRQEEKTLSKRQPPARGCRCVSCPLPSSLSHLLTNLPTSQAGDHLLPHFHPSRQPLSITVGKQKVTSVLESAPSKRKTKLRGVEERVHATRKWESGTLTATTIPRFPHHACWHRHC